MPTDDASSSSRFDTISSPERLRAMAHPLRLELIDHLRGVDSSTATECAEVVGESVASCSFHLRMLEKYGFVERAERRGREKPWRLKGEGAYDLRPTPDQPGSYPAVAAVASLQLLRETERIQQFLNRIPELEPEWVDASTMSQSTFWATAEELKQLGGDLRDLVGRFEGREDPAQRPDGARHSRMFGVVNPDADTEHHHDPDRGAQR